MSWTYDLNNLAAPLNQVRLNTGQTKEFSHVALQDEEINFLLLANSNDVNKTSIQSLDAMIAKAGSLVNSTTGMTSESLSDLLDNLQKTKTKFISNTVGLRIIATGLFDDEFHEGQQNPDFVHFGIEATDEGPLVSDDLKITVTQTANGTITPTGTESILLVREFTDQEFVIKPDAGFKIATITVDSVAVTVTDVTGQTFTFINVKENHTITATYIAE